MFVKAVNPILGRGNQLTLAESLVDFWGGGIAVASSIPPVNGNNAATSSDAIDSRKFRFLMFILSVGVIDEAVDFKLQESETAGGSYTDVADKAAAQIADTGDNGEKVIFVKTSELTATKPFVKAVVTVGLGTSSLICLIGLGIDPISDPVEDVDLATVSEIIGGSSYRGAVAKFYTNTLTPTKDTVLADLTISTLASSGVALDSWEGPVNLDNGAAAMHHNISAIAGPAPTEEILKGIVVLDSTETNILHIENFPGDGVPIVNEGDSVVYEMVLPLPGTLATGLAA